MGEMPVRHGTQGNGGLPSQLFPCIDGAVMVLCGNNEQFRRFCVALAHPNLVDNERIVSNPARACHRKQLTETFDAITRNWRQADMLASMNVAGVPAGPVYNLRQAFEDPQVQHRGVAIEVSHPLDDKVKIYTNTIKFSEMPITDYIASPILGQHNDEIYKGLLRLDEAELKRLKLARIL